MLHFVDRQPGLTIAELLDILRITKQSLNRVLKELIEKDFIESRTGTADRRQRLLSPTPKGHDLALRLAKLQTRRIMRALAGRRAGQGGGERFLFADDRSRRPRRMSSARLRRRETWQGARAPTMEPARVDIPDHAPHVLVVDDDRRLRDLLARFLPSTAIG